MQRTLPILSLAIFLSALLALAFCPGCSDDKKPPTKEIVAMVNGVPIKSADLDRAMAMAQKRLLRDGIQPKPDQITNLRMDTLQGLIGGELIFQESQKEGIRIEDADIEKIFGQWRNTFKNEEEFQKAIKNWNTSEQDIKLQLRKSMANKKLIEKKFADKITIPETEIKAYYDNNPDLFKVPERVRASHILIKVTPESTDAQKAEARKKIVDIQEKLKKGGDFAALAKEYSQCPSSSKGGDLNYFRRGQMVKPFEEAAFSLELGKVSDIVETIFGYHLIKTLDKQPETKIPYESVENMIASRLKEGYTLKKISEYSNELRKTAEVEIYLKKDS